MMRWPFCLIAFSAAFALDPDRSVLRLLNKQNTARILDRTQVSPELDVVVALNDPYGWWSKSARLGVFLQRRDEPGLIYQLAVANGIYDEDCLPRVERATNTDVVISCQAEKGGPGAHRKFVYDIRAKALVKRVDYGSSPAERRVTLKYQPGQEPPFRLLAGREEPAPTAKPVFRKAENILEEIGPTQVVAGTRWFGKTFYNGEGMTGVGGFGYFDPATKSPVIYSPKEIRGWSVTALLVEPDAVWLGIAKRGEWGDGGGGILRFDRSTQQVTKIALREIVQKISRSGATLVLDTEFGAALYDGSNVIRRFFVDETTDGRLRVVEAKPSPTAAPDLPVAQR
ncbi:MAG: hypothetical protein NTV52_06305 [Acidobacteria bacterium]|nr:hypothetical protein [Acidobacteriota bacterium]